MGNIVFQHVQWLILTVSLKVQINYKAVANFERPNYSDCDFETFHRQPNEINMIKSNPINEKGVDMDNLMPR